MLRLSLALAAAITLASFAETTTAQAPIAATPGAHVKRVLFIGNSLTYANDLPLLVEAMTKDSEAPLRCESATRADFSIEDHWNAGVVKKVRAGGWAFVVLQQGPSSLDSSRENLREWTKRFGTEIRAAGAVPALYMVWPDRSRLEFLPRVIESYRLANADVNGVLLPAGEVWRAAWSLRRDLELYGPDQFHPSKLGTFAAAAVIAARLSGVSPESLKSRYRLRNGDDYTVDEGGAAVVRTAVGDVIRSARP